MEIIFVVRHQEGVHLESLYVDDPHAQEVGGLDCLCCSVPITDTTWWELGSHEAYAAEAVHVKCREDIKKDHACWSTIIHATTDIADARISLALELVRDLAE